MIKPRIYSFMEGLGACRGDWGGIATPAHYGDPAWEEKVVRRSVGLMDRSYRGLVRIRGRDHVSFLNKMLTADVASLSPGEGCLNALLLPDGGFLSLFHLLRFPDSFVALADREILKRTMAHLESFVIIEEVEFIDESPNWGTIHIAGPGSRLLLRTISGTTITHIPSIHYHSLSIPGLRDQVHVVRHCPTGEEGYELIVPRGDLEACWKTVLDCPDPKPAPVGTEAFHVLRVEAGTPLFGIDIDSGLGPAEAGLHDVISPLKIGFPGCDAAHRAIEEKDPAHRLVGLVAMGTKPPEPGTLIMADGIEAGRITSAVYSRSLSRILAFGIVEQPGLKDGAELQASVDSSMLDMKITETPFR